ncbi:hypothetical protein CONPUDRAFT_155487 [Coniophora puteana RWD-64-598 SS2]|uniref:Uncharacterized protein n=1 Tax=Coniophora puteana (strain RWD-64-598) TaxID=741705 RepID=A0A5M3MLT2_CONPW|nr:uncharacterized protein CONPUDRAFT_155487 [Coniophora puteana RWD-64-598 SS2]EIW80128.1 hypothetical protein CONPUDRAFT_155487 [Coniophora puteana RWD-64-598 SS2]
MELSSPINAIIYPDISVNGTGSVTICPFEISVAVIGDIPPHLVQQKVPVSISVSVSRELQPFTNLFVRARPVGDEEGEEHSPSMSPRSLPRPELDSPVDAYNHSSYYDQDIPFVPLPSAFDRYNPAHWARLSENISDYVVSLQPDSGMRSWGTNMYWVSWVGANVNFPFGEWSKWDGEIPLEGSFIESWLADAYARGSSPVAEDALDVIWSEFLRYTSLFANGPIISTLF